MPGMQIPQLMQTGRLLLVLVMMLARLYSLQKRLAQSMVMVLLLLTFPPVLLRKTLVQTAVEADDKFTVKLNNVEIAKDVALEADDTAETIAGKVFTELGGTAGAALNGVDLFGDGTLYTVEQDGTKLKFTLESTPTADNIKGNFDWDIESDTVLRATTPLVPTL